MARDETPPLPGKPDLEAAKAAFAHFVETVAWLRDPRSGCPWDLKQDHTTLRRYMIEEAYEAAEAMQEGKAQDLKDELGDVLLQVVLNAQVARDQGDFSIEDVVKAIDEKMCRRHPHVFGTEEKISADQVKSNWSVIKAAEKAAKGGDPAARQSLMAEAENKQPATLQAHKIGKIAAKIRFDWDHPDQVFDQLQAEIEELRVELKATPINKGAVAAEIGDVYFSLAQLCRHLDIDPEIAALEGNRKFLRRFAALETIAKNRGTDVRAASRDELEALWKAVKVSEKNV